MTGIEFLKLAIRLSASSEEADLRSAVSRAYYGAFHLAAAFVDSFGVDLPATAEAHQKLVFCLAACNDAQALLVSRHLSGLRIERNVADYDLSDPGPFTRGGVAARIQAALRVESLLSQCAAEPQRTAISGQLRDYARNTLRLNVR